jgi:outer membrane lipoprotein-sorting protein
MKRILPAFLLLLCLSLPALAQQDEVAAAEQYLNTLRTLKGNFVQTDGMGREATGRFYLKRPGRLRFEYDAPLTDFIVADGKFIYYYDGEMKQQSNALIGQSLADFFLRKNLTLSGDLTASDVKRDKGTLEITLAQTSDPAAGSLTLRLAEEPMQLRGWRIVDAQGSVTDVALSDVESGMKLDSDLFRYYDPEKKKEKFN